MGKAELMEIRSQILGSALEVDIHVPKLFLKGPKREIFVAGIFAQIRPIWIGYLGTRPKNPKKICLGP